MKIFIKKISFLLLSFAFIFTACENEETLKITTPDAAFVLQQPGISTVFLNFALPDNPAFTIAWNDDLTDGGSYTIEMDTDAEFSAPITAGTSDTNNFSMTVSEFNDAITSTGVTSFKDIPIYFRVSNGSTLSNSVLMLATTYPVTAPVINSPSNGDSFVLSIDDNTNIATTVEWTDPILDSSLGMDVDYILEAALAGTDFATPNEAGNAINLNSIDLTHSELNAAAIKSGVAADETGNIDMRLVATITDLATGSVLERTSSPITISVTTYMTALDLTTEWGIVGDATPNSWNGPDIQLLKTSTDGVLIAYAALTIGEIKFRQNNSWDAPNKNYGGSDGVLAEGGSNIAISAAGDYKVTVNFNDNTYSVELYSFGIVGGATPNQWNGPDLKLEYDRFSDVFRAIVTLTDGEIKFRENNSWDAPSRNFGGTDGVLSEGGANIVVSAGIYIVTVDLNNSAYTLEGIDSIWGLVGDATPNSWDGPDVPFTRDWSRPFDNIWIANDVTLTDGQFKIRANNSWDAPNKNYGDNDGDGVLEEGGANIVTTAGTYSFVLNFNDPDSPTYTQN